MRKLVLFLLVLSGCHNTAQEKHAFNPQYTKLGIPYVIQADIPDCYEKDNIPIWLDRQYANWISHKTEWKCGDYTEDSLLAIIKLYPIVIYNGYTVLGDGKHSYWGFCFYNDYIQIAFNRDYQMVQMSQYDLSYWPIIEDTKGEATLVGLYGLSHEWTHAILGAWHPE